MRSKVSAGPCESLEGPDEAEAAADWAETRRAAVRNQDAGASFQTGLFPGASL